MKTTTDIFVKLAQSHPGLFYELTSEDIKKLHAALLEMFLDVKKVCDKYGLQIQMSGGSLIGTVRHQGFIPWDDDLDLMMPRNDYDKLISVFDKELSKKYDLSVPRSANPSLGLFMKIFMKGTKMVNPRSFDTERLNGIFIDIFPIEQVPDNKLLREVKFKYLDLLRICVLSTNIVLRRKSGNDFMMKKIVNHNIKHWLRENARYVLGLLMMIFGRNNLINYYDRVASSSSGLKYCSIPTGRKWSKGECHPTEVFFPSKKAIFEGEEVLIPNREDKYLSRLHGNYMQIPPPEKRERHYYVELDFGDKFENISSE